MKKSDLHQHEKALPPQHERAEAHGREPEGEHVGRGGDGRVAQIGLHDDVDAKPHDRDARQHKRDAAREEQGSAQRQRSLGEGGG